MNDKEKLLKDKLIKLDTEYECSISAGTHREPDEISDDAYDVINQLIADESITDIKSVDDAQWYVDWYKERY